MEGLWKSLDMMIKNYFHTSHQQRQKSIYWEGESNYQFDE